MRLKVFLTTALLGVAPTFACEGEPWLELKIIAGEMAGHQATEMTTIDFNGCVASEFAEFDIRAGAYQRHLDPAQRDALQTQLLAVVGFDAAATQAQLEQPPVAVGDQDALGPTLFHVSGADTYQLTIHSGTTTKEISWRAPREMARARSDVTALVDLAQFFDTLREVAADPRKGDVQELLR